MSTQPYTMFLQTKRIVSQPAGVDMASSQCHPTLFPFQRDITAWAARKGRAAIFADTGLGKTFMQVDWARLMDQKTLIIAPLSVARQTVKIAQGMDIDVQYVRDGRQVGMSDIYITNYEMAKHFDPSQFGAVILDESSILKSLTGKIRQLLTEMFEQAPYRLCCTATPAPNDIAEIANHAAFLGIMTRAEMLASFFVHDDEGWRLRGHAEEPFYRWLASWSMSVRKPSDIGYADDGFVLPPLNINPHLIPNDYVPSGQLCFTGLGGLRGRLEVRRRTIGERADAVAGLVNGNGDQWIVWCGLNDESQLVSSLIPGSVEVKGADSIDQKINNIDSFLNGNARVLVTKQRIAGFGMNFQNCHNMAFMGLSDSWEAYYQAIRRCYRFGQKHSVNVHVVIAEESEGVLHNIERKEKVAMTMMGRLIDNVAEYERAELDNLALNGWTYETNTLETDDYTLMLGDAAERLQELEDESIDLSVFSPPFASLYTYSPSERDLGNSQTREQFFEHFSYIIAELLRVTKPGRNCAVHAADIPAMIVRDGYIGLKDFSGDVIEAFTDKGWVYHGRVTIDKNPQAQAIRTHSKALLFAQLEKDSSWCRPALGDYILIFRKKGENAVPVLPVQNGDMTRDIWIEWARPIWTGINETQTLQYRMAREDKDDRHICPLQLQTIERCIKLWSNPGETILSPFAGIGSEGHEAIKWGRKFIGIELKPLYFKWMVRNVEDAVIEKNQPTLFDELAPDLGG